MRSRTPLVIAALFAGVLVAPALDAQELQHGLQYDGTALDAAGAKPKKAKPGKKTVAPAEAQPAKTGKPGGDRQFGELEGWSPGKTPPKPEEKDTSGPARPATPVNVTPSGNLGIGLPF
ncbi:MAG TPA: hypothetical protein VEH76_00455 [Methylocystis sp.]|nr:hypothetical protein [Methylocystis sp.]